MLDTDICIYLIKKHPTALLNKIKFCSPGDLSISSVTMAELYYGASKSQYCEKNIRALEKFFISFEIMPFDERAALIYGDIRASLENCGKTIGPLDLMIAAHAKSLGLTLVTNNTKEFSRVASLEVENWAK